MDIATENYQLKWHSFGNHLHSCVAAALNGDYFTDVALLTMDGRQILAHRFILSACSQYLQQVLKLQTKVSMNTPLIIILPPEINYKTLKVLIQYMYSGETTVSQDILESVLRGGDILKVKGLWRPREEEGLEKRMNVRLHQRVGSSNSSTPAPTPIPEQSAVKELCKTPKPKDKPGITKENNNKESMECNKLNEDDTVIKTTSTLAHEIKDEPDKTKDAIKTPDLMLVIKDEPIEWTEVTEEDIELVEQSELFEGDLMIKPEVQLEEFDDIQEELYTPLTCELCSETFTIPADWVKHVQTHTDMMPAKRQKRGRPSCDDEDPGTFPPLQCDMCQEFFATPAKWVQHIQSAHTEQELHANNTNKPAVRPIRSSTSRIMSPTHKACTICTKKFPSHASMLIHRRTHTGERPYMCHYCCKGFNVKSNLLRHLRTLHDKCVNPNDIDGKDDGETDDV